MTDPAADVLTAALIGLDRDTPPPVNRRVTFDELSEIGRARLAQASVSMAGPALEGQTRVGVERLAQAAAAPIVSYGGAAFFGPAHSVPQLLVTSLTLAAGSLDDALDLLAVADAPWRSWERDGGGFRITLGWPAGA